MYWNGWSGFTPGRDLAGRVGLLVHTLFNFWLNTETNIHACMHMLIIELCGLEQQTQSRVHDLLSECNLQLSDLCSFTQAAISISGVIGGPLLGLFTIGILCPFANSKVSLSSFDCTFLFLL